MGVLMLSSPQLRTAGPLDPAPLAGAQEGTVNDAARLERFKILPQKCREAANGCWNGDEPGAIPGLRQDRWPFCATASSLTAIADPLPERLALCPASLFAFSGSVPESRKPCTSHDGWPVRITGLGQVQRCADKHLSC
jgi:hypothetical protein